MKKKLAAAMGLQILAFGFLAPRISEGDWLLGTVLMAIVLSFVFIANAVLDGHEE